MLNHVSDRGKGLVGRETYCDIPTGHGYPFGGGQHLLPQRIDHQAGALVALNEVIEQGFGTW